MKLVHYDELAQMPYGTVFCEWTNGSASHLFVKGGTHKFGSGIQDWSFLEWPLEPETPSTDHNAPPGIATAWIRRLRWDTGTDQQLYAVLEDKERLKLISLLSLQL
jgi:hypothetical protein